MYAKCICFLFSLSILNFFHFYIGQIHAVNRSVSNASHRKIPACENGRVAINVRRYSELTGRPEDLTGVMASARDITGYAPPPYDHKINVWGGAGGGQTWQRINTYITAIKLLLRPIKLQFQ